MIVRNLGLLLFSLANYLLLVGQVSAASPEVNYLLFCTDTPEVSECPRSYFASRDDGEFLGNAEPRAQAIALPYANEQEQGTTLFDVLYSQLGQVRPPHCWLTNTPKCLEAANLDLQLLDELGEVGTSRMELAVADEEDITQSFTYVFPKDERNAGTGSTKIILMKYSVVAAVATWLGYMLFNNVHAVYIFGYGCLIGLRMLEEYFFLTPKLVTIPSGVSRGRIRRED